MKFIFKYIHICNAAIFLLPALQIAKLAANMAVAVAALFLNSSGKNKYLGLSEITINKNIYEGHFQEKLEI